MICPNCKNPIKINDSSCEWCGFGMINDSKQSSMESVADSATNYKPNDKEIKIIGSKVISPKFKLILIVGFILLTLVILGIIITEENQKHYNDNIPPLSYEENDKEKESSPEEAREVKFNNNTSRKIFLSISYKINNNWKTYGWHSINPQSSESIELPQSMNENSIYWYAYSGDGMEWSGYERDFIVDKYSKTRFEVLDGIVEVDGSGKKQEKGFNKLVLETKKTDCNISE